MARSSSDVGLLECDLPPLPLIASTQMHNATPERVAFLEKVGFQRVILARELTLDQIREIRRQTRIELEYFVHGALRLLQRPVLPQLRLGRRSGNRGQCAQPCRKPNSLGRCPREDAGPQATPPSHSRDLNLSEHLRPFLEAGVRSLRSRVG